MKTFLDKMPEYDHKELNKVCTEVLSISGVLSSLEKKLNKCSNYEKALYKKNLYRLKKISEDLDYIFLED